MCPINNYTHALGITMVCYNGKCEQTLKLMDKNSYQYNYTHTLGIT